MALTINNLLLKILVYVRRLVKKRKWRSLDSKTRTTTSTKFSQYQVVRTGEQAPFWRENVIAVVILLRVLARNSLWREQQQLEVYHFATGRGLNLLQ